MHTNPTNRIPSLEAFTAYPPFRAYRSHSTTRCLRVAVPDGFRLRRCHAPAAPEGGRHGDRAGRATHGAALPFAPPFRRGATQPILPPFRQGAALHALCAAMAAVLERPWPRWAPRSASRRAKGLPCGHPHLRQRRSGAGGDGDTAAAGRLGFGGRHRQQEQQRPGGRGRLEHSGATSWVTLPRAASVVCAAPGRRPVHLASHVNTDHLPVRAWSAEPGASSPQPCGARSIHSFELKEAPHEPA